MRSMLNVAFLRMEHFFMMQEVRNNSFAPSVLKKYQNPSNSTPVETFDPTGIYENITPDDHVSPLSIVNEHVTLSEYHDVDRINNAIIDSPQHLLMISVNIVSLPKNVDKIKSLIKKAPKASKCNSCE